ncbi:hypothetical protein LTR53_020425, partial [Teratosphaeriaceae sp. CCFEE 6253]
MGLNLHHSQRPRYRLSAEASRDTEFRPLVDMEMRDLKQPFAEPMVEEPMLPGRRRLGVFDNSDYVDDVFYAPVEAFEGRHR